MDNGKKKVEFERVLGERIRKSLDSFVENNNYVIMYKGSEINIYPKGSVFRLFDGVMQKGEGDNAVDLDILGKPKIKIISSTKNCVFFTKKIIFS